MERFRPKEGTILIPKPDKARFFSKGIEYVVTKNDVIGDGTIGDYWMVKTPANQDKH